jgi:hypothetical protein
MPNVPATKAQKHTYPAYVDLSETVTSRGKTAPRYWGQSRPDGVLTDSKTGRAISPTNAPPKVVLITKASGVMVRNIAEEQRELRAVAYG